MSADDPTWLKSRCDQLLIERHRAEKAKQKALEALHSAKLNMEIFKFDEASKRITDAIELLGS